MRPISRSTSTVKTAVRSDDKAHRMRQTILTLAAASALALCSIGLAQADTWVTVNPDGSVTRTITTPANARGDIYDDETYRVNYPPAVPNVQPNVQFGSGQTTFYSGTHYPLPNVYPYYHPGGVTYPIGPQIPGFQAPTITTLPSRGYHYGYPPYGYPAYPVYPQPYPLYGSTGTYYSGPAGGGGTIHSSTTTSNNGISIGRGKRGWNFNVGNGTRSRTSTTTVTTSR